MYVCKCVCVCAILQHGEKRVNMIITFYRLLKVLGNQMIFLGMKYIKKLLQCLLGMSGFLEKHSKSGCVFQQVSLRLRFQKVATKVSANKCFWKSYQWKKFCLVKLQLGLSKQENDISVGIFLCIIVISLLICCITKAAKDFWFIIL